MLMSASKPQRSPCSSWSISPNTADKFSRVRAWLDLCRFRQDPWRRTLDIHKFIHILDVSHLGAIVYSRQMYRMQYNITSADPCLWRGARRVWKHCRRWHCHQVLEQDVRSSAFSSLSLLRFCTIPTCPTWWLSSFGSSRGIFLSFFMRRHWYRCWAI